LRGEAVWRAHRSHYYQRLVQLGWGHRRTVTVEYAVMLACAALAWQMKSANTWTQWVMLCALAGGYILAAAAIHRRERIGDADFKT
jgi:hypothetical protein